MPYAIMLRKQALLDAGPTGSTNRLLREAARNLALTPLEAAQVQLVLEVALALSALVFALVHVAAVPWMLARVADRQPAQTDPRTLLARRIFTGVFGLLLACSALLGAAGWIWLLVF
jgi:hypothetical protein